MFNFSFNRGVFFKESPKGMALIADWDGMMIRNKQFEACHKP